MDFYELGFSGIVQAFLDLREIRILKVSYEALFVNILKQLFELCETKKFGNFYADNHVTTFWLLQ